MVPALRWSALFLLLVLAAVSLPGAASVGALGEVLVVPSGSDPLPAPALQSSPGSDVVLIEARIAASAAVAAPAVVTPATPATPQALAFGGPPLPQPVPPPPLPASVFEEAQVVSFYGYPGFPIMGALGAYDPDEAIAAVARVAAEYDATNGERRAVPALHLITAVAQKYPGRDGLYLERMSAELLSSYVEAARRHGALLFLDIQVGWSDVLLEVGRLADVLREPFVHLALDPEFATRQTGLAPGIAIGSLDAEQVNAVQRYLARLVRTLRLPPKVLVLHQFLDDMLIATDDYDDVPEVEIAIDMDGYGGDGAKLSKYERYALSSYSERAAIKLFYEWDTPLITPARLQALETPPDLVIYQ